MIKFCLTILISLFLITGCVSKTSVETINFASWGSATEVKIIKQILINFEKDNPNIKVNFMHFPQNYFQKIHLLFASKTAPDVVFMNNLYLPIYANQLLDLTPYINKKDFYKQSIESLSYDNKILGIPRDLSILVLYINKDLIKLPSKNMTLEELVDYIRKNSNKNAWGISFEEDIFFAEPYLSYFGEKIEENFDTRNSIGLNYYLDLRDKYHIAPKKSEIGSLTLAQMFLNQKIAIYLSGRWIYPKINETANFDWEVYPFPTGKSPINCDCSGWVISKNTKHKEAAIKLIQYLANENSSKLFMDTGLIIPARIDISKKLNSNTHNEIVFINVIKNSKTNITNKNYKKIVDKINTYF